MSKSPASAAEEWDLIQFYNIARGSTGEVRSLLYVISDNYPRSAPVAERLRGTSISVGKLVSGLL
ncbi:MAG: hypothetical protein WAN04_09970, partial [Candidatus Udaeobacter sp.]